MILENLKKYAVNKELKEITFGLLSPEYIRKMSVAKIVTADTYDEDGYPIEGGLMDLRLGVIDPGLVCKTCGGRVGECPGHFGHIELAKPVIHVGYAKTIYKILKAVCPYCGRVTLPETKRKEFLEKMELLETEGGNKWEICEEIFKEAAKIAICPYCGEVKFDVKFERPYTYYKIEENEQKKLTPEDVREILEKIPDEDCPLIGINPKTTRPEWMVLTVLPVPPVTMRPSIILETGERSEDDLTHKLVDIIRTNNKVEMCIETGSPNVILDDQWDLLQYHVATYFDNELSGMPPAKHRSGRPLKTLAQRLKGKEGRFRYNLAGKRVNFSARTVISPDPCLSINEVGVPEEIAKELTVPEKVTKYNIEKIRQLILNGPHKHPGANYIIVKKRGRDGSYSEYKIKLENENIRKYWAENIKEGDIVERHLMDGDIVLYNRQPSLHRMSIMGHRVRVLPYRTFRHNLCVCPPYNADFDGDEMNLHVPQTEEARAEAESLMLVEKHILSPRYGGPIIGAIHDHISGAYILTSKYFTKDEATLILRAGNIKDELEEPDKVENGVELYSGKRLFSKALPKGLNIRFKARICRKCKECKKEECEYDAYVVIKDGELIKGVIDKSGYGAESGILLHAIVKEFGYEAGRRFLDSVTKMVIRTLMLRGFSTGIDDEDVPKEALEEIEKVLDEAEKKVEEIIEKYKRGELELLPGQDLEQSRETYIKNILREARDKAGEIAERYLGMDNQAVIMARTGARGNILNLTQMAACVGQQSVRGERIFRGYRDRVLPHFEKGDLGARAHGFVRSSYKKGLSPTEFFFHAIGGREGLVDQAVRTAQSGYMQRRLINALQDLKTEFDGTVRDSRGVMIQFKYGEDGVDPMLTDRGKTVDIDRIIDKIKMKYSN
ncbi:DNA-directed RNA polymerase subunit A' [Methanocaldococcus indicus]|uniref:DNA-directed RNA polymerase subunit A' n=1 Tax=Methanocaldococcus indicus TaxID=213231 RepID=UPI003C6CF85C